MDIARRTVRALQVEHHMRRLALDLGVPFHRRDETFAQHRGS